MKAFLEDVAGLELRKITCQPVPSRWARFDQRTDLRWRAFFNALVVGVLGGQPEWHPFTLSSRVPAHELGALTERDQDLVGYLQLSGEETLFALDGQHRLAGIKRALANRPSLGGEKLALLFVPHVGSPAGLVRTRSLFISLNKKAIPVKRKDIIILDEVTSRRSSRAV